MPSGKRTAKFIGSEEWFKRDVSQHIGHTPEGRLFCTLKDKPTGISVTRYDGANPYDELAHRVIQLS